jgi:hypothetical protein
MSNDELYEHAMSTIRELFGDTRVSKRTTLDNLNSLIGEISIMADALAMEMRDEE